MMIRRARAQIYADVARGRATTQVTSSSPTGTTSTSRVFLGLAASITPLVNTVVSITATGNFANNTAGDGINIVLKIGTGTAPSNGTASTGVGTQLGLPVQCTPQSATLLPTAVPFSITGLMTGLAVGTPYWIDIAFAAVAGGTAACANVTLVAIEV